MTGKNKNKSRNKNLHRASINQVFAKVIKVKMFGEYWLNGQDGYFYRLDSPDQLSTAIRPNKCLVERRPLDLIYKYMQRGYNVNGDLVCYRKHCFNGAETPLFRCKRFGKKH